MTSAPNEASDETSTLYERVGGAWFEVLTARFYASVADDPVLRRLYPDDLAAAVRAGGLSTADELAMLRYFAGTATQLTNQP